MKEQVLRITLLALLVVGFQSAGAAQEAVSKTQEQVARAQETAARNQETAARLAAEAAGEPESAATARDASARARDAANRAQDAANRAQSAAEKDPASAEAQAAALRAQEAANRALESANRAREFANRLRGTSAAVTGDGASLPAPDSNGRGPSGERDAARSPDGVTSAGVVGASHSGVASAGAPTGANAAGSGAGGATTPAAGAAGGAGGSTSANGAGDSSPQAAGTAKTAVSTEAKDFNNFLNARTEEIAIASLGPKNNTNQSETPSIGSNSTSLVEKSSVGDLLGFALNPSGTSGGSALGDATSSSVTITAYALKAFLSGVDPLDPAFYTANRRWRKFSFTYGHDFPEGEAGNPRERGDIYGIKFLPYDKRDPSNPSNRKLIRDISEGLQDTGIGFANLDSEVADYIFARLEARGALPAKVTAITDADKRFELRDRHTEFRKFLGTQSYADLVALIGEDGIKEVDNIIARHKEFARFDKKTEDIINKLRSRPQVSMFFLTKQRHQTRPDEYNAGLSLDLGVADRWNLTFNGGLSYTDNKLSADERGGKFGTELMIPLTAMKRLADRAPATFSFAASGEWKTNVAPMYQGQAKLTIPIPFLPGMQMPISVSFASRTELVHESDVRGRVGFTFDVARLLAELKAKFLSGLPLPAQ